MGDGEDHTEVSVLLRKALTAAHGSSHSTTTPFDLGIDGNGTADSCCPVHEGTSDEKSIAQMIHGLQDLTRQQFAAQTVAEQLKRQQRNLLQKQEFVCQQLDMWIGSWSSCSSSIACGSMVKGQAADKIGRVPPLPPSPLPAIGQGQPPPPPPEDAPPLRVNCSISGGSFGKAEVAKVDSDSEDGSSNDSADLPGRMPSLMKAAPPWAPVQLAARPRATRRTKLSLAPTELTVRSSDRTVRTSSATEDSSLELQKATTEVRRYSLEEHHKRLAHIRHGGRNGRYGSEQSEDAVMMRTSTVAVIADKIAKNYWFDYAFSVILVFNCILVGIEADQRAMHGQANSMFKVSEYVFCVLFMIELVIRMTSVGFKYYFQARDGTLNVWNIFDLVVVAITTLCLIGAEIVGDDETSSEVSNLKAVRIVRVVRITRVIRLIRVFKFFRSLRMLVLALFGTVKSCVWTLMMLILIVYIIGITFTIAITEGYFQGASDPTAHKQLYVYWGTLPRAMYTLFMSFCGGIDWEIAAQPLSDVSWLMVAFFVLYISFVYLAVMNVVTGLFCQNAIETARQDRDEVIQEHAKQRTAYVRKLRDLFASLTQTANITLPDFEEHIKDSRMVGFFKALDIEITDAWTVFKLLDTDNTGTVDAEQFVDGCLRLKGDAKAMQVAQLNYEFRWLADKVIEILKTSKVVEEKTKAVIDGVVPVAKKNQNGHWQTVAT